MRRATSLYFCLLVIFLRPHVPNTQQVPQVRVVQYYKEAEGNSFSNFLESIKFDGQQIILYNIIYMRGIGGSSQRVGHQSEDID
jgi:hypothetical protein